MTKLKMLREEFEALCKDSRELFEFEFDSDAELLARYLLKIDFLLRAVEDEAEVERWRAEMEEKWK